MEDHLNLAMGGCMEDHLHLAMGGCMEDHLSLAMGGCTVDLLCLATVEVMGGLNLAMEDHPYLATVDRTVATNRPCTACGR